jgi:hypothetical protein
MGAGALQALHSGSLFSEGNTMWKIAVGFAVFAGLALFVLSKGGDIDMSGEKHGSEATHSEAPAAPASAASAASAAK